MERGGIRLRFVEVLAIIIAVGLLVCIGIPGWVHSRECPRRCECMSNLKQMGLALNMYAQDFNECFPTTVGTNESGKPPIALKAGDGLAGLKLLFKLGYITDPKVLGCPTAISKGGVDPTDEENGIPAKGCTKDNCHYGYDPRHKTTHPGGTAIAADRADLTDPHKYSPNHTGFHWSHVKNPGQNILYVDGHVRWYGRTDLGLTKTAKEAVYPTFGGNEIYDGSDDATDPEGASHIIQ